MRNRPHRRYWQSSSFKMAVITTVLMVGAIILLARMLDAYQRDTFTQFISAALDGQIQSMTAHHEVGGLISLQNEIRDLAVRDPALYYLVVDEESRFVAGNFRRLPSNPTLLSEGLLGFELEPENQLRARRDGAASEPVSVAAKIVTFEEGYRLLVARNMASIYRLQEQIELMEIVMFALMLGVVLVAFFISFYVVKRINGIAATARSIMETGDLSKRIVIENRWDDLGNLSVVLNELLARVEDLMQGVRQVSDNIAHDLRTPLSRLRNHIEELLSEKKVQDAPVIKAKVDQISGEADHILNTFQAVLRIANIEKGKRHKPFQTIDLQQLLKDVVELYAPLAEEKQIHFVDRLGVASVRGDKDLLFQALANLVDNAIKYTPEEGDVRVTLMSDRSGPVVEVLDSGPGIPEEEREKVFRRFYRMDSARTSAGVGLGLPMVAAVLDLHEVHMSLHDNAPGLRVHLKFPKKFTK